MSEIITNGYKRLFEIRLLHHYWLDDGLDLFDNLMPLTRRENRLLTYDRRPFLNIQPTATTAAVIKGLQCVYKDTALGAVVVAPGSAPVPDDTLFEFVVTVQHSHFNNYTAHSFYDHKIYEIFYAPEEKIYRFKENVFVLNNTTGTKRSSDLFLSKEFPAFVPPATNYPIEALLQSGGSLVEITDEIGGTASLYAPTTASALPVFLNQEDIPPIVPPAGLVGAPARGLTLTPEIPDNVYALIRVRAVHPTDALFSCTTGGVAKPVAPVFQVRFKNRHSIWRYKSKTNPSLPATDLGLLPLTFFGNASPGPPKSQKPSEGGIKVQFEDDDPSKNIEKIISEIFI